MFFLLFNRSLWKRNFLLFGHLVLGCVVARVALVCWGSWGSFANVILQVFYYCYFFFLICDFVRNTTYVGIIGGSRFDHFERYSEYFDTADALHFVSWFKNWRCSIISSLLKYRVEIDILFFRIDLIVFDVFHFFI